MKTDRLVELIDNTGIETIVGGRPIPLPDLTAVEMQALEGAQAVLRVVRGGLESTPYQRWIFVLPHRMIQLSSDNKHGAKNPFEPLAGPAALLEGIEQSIPVSAEPRTAYARAKVRRGDAVNIRDQIAGDDINTATEFLVSDGLTLEEADEAFDVMRASSVNARISFMAVRGDDLVLTYGMAVGQAGSEVWMVWAEPPQSEMLTLEVVLAGAVHERLEAGWASLGLAHWGK